MKNTKGKKCTQCKKYRLNEVFSLRPDTGRLHTICKLCIEIYRKEYRKIHPYNYFYTLSPEKKKKFREYYIKYSKTPKGKLISSRAVKKWEAKNREKVKIHRKINNLIRDKKLERKPCIVCGDKKSDAHHPDYSKPLEVMWLCRLHHKAEHSRLLN